MMFFKRYAKGRHSLFVFTIDVASGHAGHVEHMT